MSTKKTPHSGKYIGGQNAPIGTFVNPRTMAYFQQASDGTLPLMARMDYDYHLW